MTAAHHRKVYLLVWAVLLVLLAATILASSVRAGAFSLVLAIGIAAVKASLIVVYFMHLRSSPRIVWVVAAATVVWLGIMFGLTFADYETRSFLPKPTTW